MDQEQIKSNVFDVLKSVSDPELGVNISDLGLIEKIIVEDKHYLEKHLQRIYSIKEISDLIKESGLTLYKLTENFSQKEGSEKSDRIHFICKKNRFNNS